MEIAATKLTVLTTQPRLIAHFFVDHIPHAAINLVIPQSTPNKTIGAILEASCVFSTMPPKFSIVCANVWTGEKSANIPAISIVPCRINKIDAILALIFLFIENLPSLLTIKMPK